MVALNFVNKKIKEAGCVNYAIEYGCGSWVKIEIGKTEFLYYFKYLIASMLSMSLLWTSYSKPGSKDFANLFCVCVCLPENIFIKAYGIYFLEPRQKIKGQSVNIL